MTYWQRLWRIEIIGLGSLGLFSAAIATILVVESLVMSPMEFSLFDVAFREFAFTLMFGFVQRRRDDSTSESGWLWLLVLSRNRSRDTMVDQLILVSDAKVRL